jgi:hypothetical protein
MPKTSAKEIEARKQAARLQDEQRLWIEVKIAELQKQGWTTDQICEEVGLLTPPEFSPAMQFLLDRTKGVDVSVFDDEMHRAMVDLLLSDMPLDLDRLTRQLIAYRLSRLAFPNPPKEKLQKRRMEADVAASLKRRYQERGMTALEAEQTVAENLGLTSVDALRKKRQRARSSRTK